jgi:hypothetical protein
MTEAATPTSFLRQAREEARTSEPPYAWARSTVDLQAQWMEACGDIEGRRTFERVIQERRSQALRAPHTTAAERLAIMEAASSSKDRRPDVSFLS